MAARTFVAADLHFGDASLCGIAKSRPRSRPFGTADEMNAEIVRRWNETVCSSDVVHVLGDVGRGSHANLVAQLNGVKHLIAGNGDALSDLVRRGLFRSVKVLSQFPGIIMTHVPVHPQLLRGATRNIHGHLHGASVPDARYICVSMEQTDFRPVLLEDVLRSTAVASPPLA